MVARRCARSVCGRFGGRWRVTGRAGARTAAPPVSSAGSANRRERRAGVFGFNVRAPTDCPARASPCRGSLPPGLRRTPRNSPEHRARHQTRAPGIVEVEQSADQLAGAVQPRNRTLGGVEDTAPGVDPQAPERESDSAGHGIGLERRRVEALRPVRLRHLEPVGAASVLDRRVERDIGAHGVVVGPDGAEEPLRVDALELPGQRLEGVGGHLRHLADPVLVAQQVHHLRVEHLPCELSRLLQHRPAVPGVGVVAEVRAFVDETLPVGIHHDAERIAVLLEVVADRQIAERGCVPVPPHGVASRPVPVRHRAGFERHPDSVARVEPRAPDPCEIPAGAEVAGAPLGVRLEAAAGEHHRPSARLEFAVCSAHGDTPHRAALLDERHRARLVQDLDAFALAGLRKVRHEAGTAPPRLHREAAPEPEAPVHPERLPAVRRLEADPLVPHPHHGVEAVLDENLDQVRIAAKAGHARHVVVVLLARVLPEVGVPDLLRGEVHHLDEILDAGEHHPHRARRVAAVPSALGFGRRLQDHRVRAPLPRRQRGAHRRVAGSHHDHVAFQCPHRLFPSFRDATARTRIMPPPAGLNRNP